MMGSRGAVALARPKLPMAGDQHAQVELARNPSLKPLHKRQFWFAVSRFRDHGRVDPIAICPRRRCFAQSSRSLARQELRPRSNASAPTSGDRRMVEAKGQGGPPPPLASGVPGCVPGLVPPLAVASAQSILPNGGGPFRPGGAAVAGPSQWRPASTARSLLCRISPALTRVMALATISGPSPRNTP